MGPPERFSDYDDGRRDARLDGHDRRITEVIADQKSTDLAVSRLDLATQRLADAASASAEATIKLAEGLSAQRKGDADALAVKTDAEVTRWSRRDSWYALAAGLLGSMATAYGIFHR